MSTGGGVKRVAISQEEMEAMRKQKCVDDSWKTSFTAFGAGATIAGGIHLGLNKFHPTYPSLNFRLKIPTFTMATLFCAAIIGEKSLLNCSRGAWNK
jgi:hypothetical protein